ncbi:FAD binding domain-containing protein [Patellaria atrata CBS 101060]|uniref:FAD binding domain-containing protein n=1 Tax=Patellaria atrata CBS 101060 TaxID=1346257 RepID=A0A9P4SDH9_9PEZI|nr:FAD binding domain-containing protein [Patellaria atrata CBS 101060]
MKMAVRQFQLIVLLLSSFFTVPVFSDTCSTLAKIPGSDVFYPLALSYKVDQTQYWSRQCSAQKPKCIIFPDSAREVAAIVKSLALYNESFAIKSGGHSPNVGFSSITGGPLISLKKLNQVTYNSATQTVKIGPGNRWENVSDALYGTGVTVVGGRIGNVGVGGYMLGGGLGFLSSQYGWAMNNVVEFEVVLADGSIVTASANSHPDLYKALKGGGNNYGIVTAYTVEAHPQGKVWAGEMIFTGDKTPKILKAVRDFAENYDDDKAAIIATAETTVAGIVDIWVLFVFYDGPTPPPGIFDRFTSIGPVTVTARTTEYRDYIKTTQVFVLRGQIYEMFTETMPVPSLSNGEEVMNSIFNHWMSTTDSIATVGGLIGAMAFQPIPKKMAAIAKAKGGDLLDLDDDVDLFMIDFNYSYLLDIDTPRVDDAVQRVYNGMKQRVEAFQAQGKLPEAYLPLFMNDAYFRQDYFGRLRTAGFARQVRDQYDPNGFFRDQTAGFKL